MHTSAPPFSNPTWVGPIMTPVYPFHSMAHCNCQEPENASKSSFLGPWPRFFVTLRLGRNHLRISQNNLTKKKKRCQADPSCMFLHSCSSKCPEPSVSNRRKACHKNAVKHNDMHIYLYLSWTIASVPAKKIDPHMILTYPHKLRSWTTLCGNYITSPCASLICRWSVRKPDNFAPSCWGTEWYWVVLSGTEWYWVVLRCCWNQLDWNSSKHSPARRRRRDSCASPNFLRVKAALHLRCQGLFGYVPDMYSYVFICCT